MVVRVIWATATDRSVEERRALARTMIRSEVADLLDLDEDLVSVGAVCRHCGGPHGRPVVRIGAKAQPPAVSISRRSGTVVVAVSTEGAVGVDAERPGAAGAELGRVVLHHREQPADAAGLTTIWVRKEAVLKLAGLGLRGDPAAIAVSAPGVLPRLLAWDLPDPAPSPLWMSDLQLAAAVACVAVACAERPALSVRRLAADEAASPRAARR